MEHPAHPAWEPYRTHVAALVWKWPTPDLTPEGGRVSPLGLVVAHTRRELATIPSRELAEDREAIFRLQTVLAYSAGVTGGAG